MTFVLRGQVTEPSSKLLTFIFCVVVKSAWSYISYLPHTFMKRARNFFFLVPLQAFLCGATAHLCPRPRHFWGFYIARTEARARAPHTLTHTQTHHTTHTHTHTHIHSHSLSLSLPLSLSHTHTHTHTNPLELLWTSDQPVVETVNYTNIRNRRTDIRALNGIWDQIPVIQRLEAYALDRTATEICSF